MVSAYIKQIYYNTGIINIIAEILSALELAKKIKDVSTHNIISKLL